MTRIPFFGAAVALSALFASHASAQHMIDEPGMYAFYPSKWRSRNRIGTIAG